MLRCFRNNKNAMFKDLKDVSFSKEFPVDILINIFQLLQVSDFAKVPCLSRGWRKEFNEPSFWRQMRSNENMYNFLGLSLVYALENKKDVDVIRHYCQLGADVNYYTNARIRKDYGWLRKLDTKAFFTYATPLCVAANLASGKKGESIVRTLLEYGANPTLKSKFKLYLVSSPYGFYSEWPIAAETPADSARDKYIKAILLVAEYEFAVKNNKPDTQVSESIKKAIGFTLI